MTTDKQTFLALEHMELGKCQHCRNQFLADELQQAVNSYLYCPDCLQANFKECSDCAAWEERGQSILLHSGEAICRDCSTNERKYLLCSSCDTWDDAADYVTTQDGDLYCDQCRCDHLSWCESCEELIPSDDALSSGHKIYCQGCFDEHCFTCERCEGTGESDNSFNVNGDNWCLSCYENYSTMCEGCEESYHADSVREGSDGNSYCRECFKDKQFEKFSSTTFSLTQGYKRRYGIEIECFRPSDGNDADSEGFMIGDDGSIAPPRDKDTTYHSQEHRSGILQGDKGIELLRRHCKLLQENGYDVNKSCGLHVHVDATDLKQEELLNITSFVRIFDDVIFALTPKSRRDNNYCRRVGVTKENIHRVHKKEATFSGLFEGGNRYKGFNIQAYYEHGTIEFRYHSGTINEEKIHHWVNTCLAIVEVNKGLTWLAVKKAVSPTRKNLERFLAILKLPEDTKTYLRARFEKFYIEPKKPAAFNSKLEKLLDIVTRYIAHDNDASEPGLSGEDSQIMRSFVAHCGSRFSRYSQVRDYISQAIDGEISIPAEELEGVNL